METLKQYLTAGQRGSFQKHLQQDLPSSYRQRLQIMLLADQGQTQKEICQVLGCCPATANYWMKMVRAGLAERWQDCPIGRPKSVSDEYIQRLHELLEGNPRDYGYFFQRWTVYWLSQQLEQELKVGLSVRHLKRIMKQLGLSTLARSKQLIGHPVAASAQQMGNASIEITNLHTDSTNNLTPFIPDSIQINIYGSQSIHPVHYSTATQYRPRCFHFVSRISALHTAR